MIISNLISQFRTIIELDSSGLPGLTDDEIVLFLDNAQNAFISQRLQGHTVDKTKYPETQKRIDDLNKLYTFQDTSSFTVSSITSKNYYDFDLNNLSDYLHFDQAILEINDIGRFKMNRIPMHETNRFEYSNVNQPYIENPVFTILGKESGEKIRVYFDLDTAKEESWSMFLDIGYFKTPTNLTSANTTSDVNDFSYAVYKEIIKIAVDEAISIIAPQKIQVSQQQVNKSE